MSGNRESLNLTKEEASELLVTMIPDRIEKIENELSMLPKLTVPANIVAKRTHVSRRRSGDVSGHYHHHTSTSYYVTFQVESGDRIELHLSGNEYGLLVEGDQGNLSFRGSRYLGFERT